MRAAKPVNRSLTLNNRSILMLTLTASQAPAIHQQVRQFDQEAVVRLTTQFCDALRDYSATCSRSQLDVLLDQIDDVVVELRKASADIRRTLQLTAA